MRSQSNSTFHIFMLFALLVSLLGSALTVTPVYAAGITVTTTADELNADGDCSLREAIQAANTDLAADACTAGSGADTITVPAGTYTLTIAGIDENVNATGDLDITSDISINGAGSGATVIRAGAAPGTGIDRVFHVIGPGVTVSISAVTVANGTCALCYGGGIYNSLAGVLTVTNSTFSDNSAGYGGGIFNDTSGTMTVTNSTFSGNIGTNGGGIFNYGTMTVTNSTFSGNSAFYSGGGIFNGSGTLTVTNSTFSDNSAHILAYGGGMYNQATLHLKNTILANSVDGVDCYNNGGDTIDTNVNNLIEANGPLGHMCGTPDVTADPDLGALADNGGATQTFGIGTDSSAYNAGDNATCAAAPVSGLDQRGVARPQNITCDIGAFESNAQPGPTFDVNTTEDSAYGSCDAFVAGASDCSLREAITAANNLASADIINVPAGTYTLTMPGAGEDANATGDLDITGSLTINGAAGSTIIQAHATPGSGSDRVFQIGAGITVSISNVTVANGVCLTCYGGGIYNLGTLTVTNSTISGNSANFGLGGGIINYTTLTVTNSTISGNSADFGGGIFNYGTLTVTNSTFPDNSANYGGGMYNHSSGTVTVTNSTFSGNSGPSNGGGIYNYFGSLHLKNTILANSASGGDCYNASGDAIATNTNNLIEVNAASPNMCGTPAVSTDPSLGALTGSPAYFPLNSGSPAINAGNDAICAAVPVSNTSQNGVTRPQGAHCDIGSFELFVYNLFLPLVLR